MLTQDRINEIAIDEGLGCYLHQDDGKKQTLWFDGDPTKFARAIEAEATAPLLARIAEMRAEMDRRCAELHARLSAAPAAQPEPVGELRSDEFEGHIFIPYKDEWPFDKPLYLSPPPAPAAPAAQPPREALIELLAQRLSGTYHCLRVWDAWRVGTMTSDDFEDVGESETPSELADEILQLIATAPAARPVVWNDSTALEWLNRIGDGPYGSDDVEDAKQMLMHAESIRSEVLSAAPAAQPMTANEIWDCDEIMEVNADAQIAFEHIKRFVKAVERHHGIKEQP